MNDLFVGMIIGALGLGVLIAITRNQDRKAALRLSDQSRSGHTLIEIAEDEGYVGDTAEVMALVRSGNKLHAIKIVRNMTGLDLKSAKELVEKMERGGTVDLSSAKRDDGGS